MISTVPKAWCFSRGRTNPCSASTQNSTHCVDDIHTTCDDMQCLRIDDMQPTVGDIHAVRDFVGDGALRTPDLKFRSEDP